MYYAMRASAPSLHRESTDSLIYIIILFCIQWSLLNPDNTVGPD